MPKNKMQNVVPMVIRQNYRGVIFYGGAEYYITDRVDSGVWRGCWLV